MNKKDLELAVKNFEKHGKTAEELNKLRSEIFDALDTGEIQTRTKDKLLKDLYFTASIKNIFFIRVTERKTAHLPKNEEEEQAKIEEEESYEEEDSYSYEESYEDDEEDTEDEDDKA
jgi:hypothetical protein